jgi:hypothetical protein
MKTEEGWQKVVRKFAKPRIKARFAADPKAVSVPLWTEDDAIEFGKLVAEVMRELTQCGVFPGGVIGDGVRRPTEDELLAAISEKLERK